MPSKKIHIVIVSTWYPPKNGVAVSRIAAFAKYLDKSKYEVSVLTEAPQDNYDYVDDSVINVFRITSNKLFKLPSFNKQTNRFTHYLKVMWKLLLLKVSRDEYSNWSKKAIEVIQKIHTKHRIDIILSSSAPFSPHILVHKFCRENKEVIWIADLRDELSKSVGVLSDYKKKARKVELLIDSTAKGIITVSKPILEDFKQLMPNIKYFEEVRNGFDHSLESTPMHFNDMFTIGYIGTFYGANKPNLFFECLKELYDSNELPSKYKIRFIGTPLNFNIPKVFENKVEFVDKLPYEETINEASTHDVNLLILNFKERYGVYSGKLFDYISVQKPILALLNKKDVAADLINEYQAGYIADADDKSDIKNNLKLAISNWKNKIAISNSRNKIKKLHRKYQVKKLELLIERIMDNE